MNSVIRAAPMPGNMFDAEEYSSAICIGTRIDTLKTGDYTLVGYENVLCIERKGTVAEFAGNLWDKAFDRELERMLAFDARYIVCEFTFEDIIRFPAGSNIPHNKRHLLRITPQFLVMRVNEIMLKQKVPVVFAGTKGKEFTSSLFKRVIENVPKRSAV